MSTIKNRIMLKKVNVIIIIAIILITVTVRPLYGGRESYAATTAILEDKWHGNYGNWQFKIKGYNGYGLCAYDIRKSAEIGTSGTVTDVTDSSVIKIVYYVLFKKNGAGLTGDEMRDSHVYISYKLNGKKSLSENALKYLDGAIKWAKQYEAMGPPLEYDQFRVYLWTPSGEYKDRQAVVFFSYITPGSINLIKSSANSKALSTGMYHLKGAEYTVFKSDRKTEEGKLVVTEENGQTNTIIVTPGTYYVRETKIPADSGFKINDSWMIAEVKTGDAVTLHTEGNAAEIPIMSRAYVIKNIRGNDPATTRFSFDLVNTNDTSIRYSVSTGTGDKLITPEVEILAGNYLVSEHTADGYETETQPYEITVKPGETAEIKWTNRMLHKGKLSVVKDNLDGLSAEGFKFKLSGVLFRKILEDGVVKYITERTLTEEDAIRRAGLYDQLNVNLMLGDWQVDHKSLKAINDAAEAGKTGKYSLIFRNEIKQEAGVIPVEIQTEVVLKQLIENSGTDVGTPITETEPVQSVLELENGVINYNKTIDFAGSRTEYLDEKTGKNYTEIIIGRDYLADREVPFGRYTVSEQLNEFQRKRYHDEDGKIYEYAGEKHKVSVSITKDITSESNSKDYIFSFKNIPRTTRVRLHKDADGKQTDGLTFNLKSVGKTASGLSYDNKFVTNQDGSIDFGELYAGTYILEESNFDSNNWVNTYPLKGCDGPAIRFTINGNEDGTVWIGGAVGKGGISVGSDDKPARIFKNKYLTKLYISKIDADNKVFLPDVKFQIKDEKGSIAAAFTLARNDAGVADIIMTSADEDITGGACIGDGVVDSSDSKAGELSNDREYIVIKGLEQDRNYTLEEVDAPDGYITANDMPFKFSDGMHIDVENSRSEIFTEVSGVETGTRISLAKEEVNLIDSVRYSKLVPGREYTLKGTLVFAGDSFKSESESAVIENGKPVISEVAFKPENTEGVQDVEFSFDGRNYAGEDVVVFEELIENGRTVVSHSDPDNKMQTVSMPAIETQATLDGSAIIDHIVYENLLSGRRYVCRGWLVNTSTGEKVKGSDGFNVFYVAEGEESGTVDIELKTDVTDIAGKKVTAFEELYLAEEDIDKDTGIPTITAEILVAEHKDLNSAEQTVDMPRRVTPKTGDKSYTRTVELIATMILSMTCVIIIIRKRRTK